MDFLERELLDRRKNSRRSNVIDGPELAQDLYNLFPYVELLLSDRDVQDFKEVPTIRLNRESFKAEG